MCMPCSFFRVVAECVYVDLPEWGLNVFYSLIYLSGG